MKKFAFMLLTLTLSMMLTGCKWFDSKPIDPKIIGTGYIHQLDNGIYTVEISAVVYCVTEVYTSKGKGDKPVISQPIDGAIVTVVLFQNAEAGRGTGVKFILGEWNEAQIEDAFRTNNTPGFCILMLLVVLIIIWMALLSGKEEKVPIVRT